MLAGGIACFVSLPLRISSNSFSHHVYSDSYVLLRVAKHEKI